jgi:two-component system, NtrC family, sensor histidine kinase PilS
VATDWTQEYRLKRLMLFRVVMITTLLLVAIYVETVSETLLPVNPLYFLIAGTYGLTLIYALALRFLPHRDLQVYVQVIFDLLVITGLVYLTGGPGSRAGFILLYPISVLSGSVLLYRRKSVALAGVATLLYAAMLWAVRAGWVPAGQALSDVPAMAVKHVLYSIFVTGVACVTVSLIGSYLAQSLETVGQKLEEAAEEVADLRELQQVMVRSIHSGLLTGDLGGRLLYVNEFGEAILGRSLSELRGRRLRDIFQSVLFEPSTLEARALHQGLERLEISYQRPTGEGLELGVSVSSLATADPGNAGYLLVFQNLTEIKRLEQEVRVKEKLAAVGEMAARLAHEIRNPLGSISGSAQVLMGEPNISVEQSRLLAIITRESKRLSDTLNQFLYQARSSPAARGPVDVGRLVSEAVTLLRNGPEVGPTHTVEFEMDTGSHVCLADPDQITQVFWNLTRNALEAMPRGGILKVRVFMDGDTLVLSCRDQGRGIGREEQRRVFEPFQSGTPMGTGLGLAIVYQIVRDHGGDIAVRSTPGQGTDVQVRIPLLVHTPVPA